MAWVYDPPSTSFNCWPTFGIGPPGWGSVRSMSQLYTPETPLVGQASLLLARNHAVTGYAGAYGPVTKVTGMLVFWGETEDDYIATPPLVQGRVRTLLQVRHASGSGRHQLGAVCLTSTDALEETGTAYGFLLDGAQTSATWERMALVHYSGPLGVRSPFLVLAETPHTASLGAVCALELRWEYLLGSGQVTLWGFLGTQADYSDLALALTWSQSALSLSPLVTEGVVFAMDAPSLVDGDLVFCVDQTTMEGTM